VADDDAGRFFSSFAKAMLERSLPAIREWLASRLGPDAVIGAVTIEDGSIVVRDSRVPIGTRLWIDVDEARLDARPEDFVAGLAPARLRSLRGAIRTVEGGATTFRAPLELEGRGAASTAWVDGELRLGGATWKHDKGVGDAVPMVGTARVTVTSDRWSIREASLTSGASQTELDAAGGLREGDRGLKTADVKTTRARLGHVLDILSVLRGAPLRLPLPVPLDATLTGTLTLDERGHLEADVEARSERSALHLVVDATGSEIAEATLTGQAAPDELLPESWAWLIDRVGSAPLTVDARGRGPLDALDGTVALASESLASPWLVEPRPARARVESSDRARRWTVDVTIDDGGEARGEVAVAPYGTIDGHATATLEPAAWALGAIRASGDPITLDARIGGSRSAPEVDFDLRSDALSLRRDAAPVHARRVRAFGRVVREGGALGLQSGSARARVGPGSAHLRRRSGATAIELSRVDATDALAAAALAVDQAWVGTDDDARFALPDGAQLWTDLTLADGALTGQAHVETPRSRLSFTPLSFAGGSFDGTEARATLAFDDAVELGLFRGSPVLPTGEGAADLHVTLTGSGAEARLHATATARRVGWRARDGEGELLALERASLDLTVGRGLLAVNALRGRLFGGELEAAGSLRREGDAAAATLDHLRLRGAGEPLRDRLLGPGHEDAWRGLSVDLDLSGDLDAVRGEASVRSERSALTAIVGAEAGAFGAGSAVSGTLHPGDLAPWSGPVTIDGDPFAVEATLSGALRNPRLELSLQGGAQTVRVGPLTAPLAKAVVEATLSTDGVDLRALRGHLAGGEVVARAVTSRRFGGSLARVTVAGVQLDGVEGVSDELGGALHADLSFWQRAERAPGARLNVRVDAPRYEALRRLASRFSRYGLRQPAREGDRPLTATVALADGALSIRDVEASTPSLGVSAELTRSTLGIWRGEAAFTARRAFLETSHLLSGPARWLGDVRIPVRVVGPEGRVAMHADVIAALDALLARTPIGRGLQRAIDELLRRFDLAPRHPDAPPARHHAKSALTSSDALIDQVAAGDEDADAALGALLERGFTPIEIVRRVAKRR